MTVCDTAAPLSAAILLANIPAPENIAALDGILKLGTTGLLVVAIWALWRRIDKKEQQEKEEKRLMHEADEKRHREDEERNKMMLDVLIRLASREDDNDR